MSGAIQKTDYMKNLLLHIEENMSNDLEAELLSSVGYVSRRKLYYDFYSISGHSVKEYIRKRRLSNALALIKMSDMGLTDIAFKCGYSSHQALCRAVKQVLNLTPSEYKSSDTYYFFPPFNSEPLQSVTVSNEMIPSTLRVLFYHSRLTDIENIAVNTFLHIFPNYEGRIFGRNGKQVGDKFCYELYLTDQKHNYDVLTSHGFEITGKIPCLNSMFASSTVINDEGRLNSAWNYLYFEWLQSSMFEYTNQPYYEEYIIKNNNPAKLKLYLPIRERSKETKIKLINNPKLCFIVASAKGHNAEEATSKTMTDYLTAHYPHILNASNELYLQKEIYSYTCGVRIAPEQEIEESKNIKITTTTENDYLVLESSVMGDYDRYADILFSFASDNGMDADKKQIFAIYDTKNGFSNPMIKMYCPVKFCTK